MPVLSFPFRYLLRNLIIISFILLFASHNFSETLMKECIMVYDVLMSNHHFYLTKECFQFSLVCFFLILDKWFKQRL